jgi:N-methylhydantoinase B
VEAIEMEYPLLVEDYTLVEDSGGAGRHRGGLGLRRTLRPVDHVCEFNGAGERFRHVPWGVFGGGDGAAGRFLLIDREEGTTRILATKPTGVHLHPHQSLRVETPGAGGYGPPAERSPDAVRADRTSGKFTPAWLAMHYGGTGEED